MPACWPPWRTILPAARPGAPSGLDHDVVSVEFKINFLRPAVADRLRCRGKVLRAGKMLVICEAEVFAEKDAEEKLVSKAMVTLAVKRAFTAVI